MYGKKTFDGSLRENQKKNLDMCPKLRVVAWANSCKANVNARKVSWPWAALKRTSDWSTGLNVFDWVMAPPSGPCLQSTTLLCEDLLTCGFDTLRLWQPWVVHLQNGGIQPHVVRAVRNVLETSLLLVHLFKWITLGFTFGVVEFQRHYYYDIIIVITILALKMALLG